MASYLSRRRGFVFGTEGGVNGACNEAMRPGGGERVPDWHEKAGPVKIFPTRSVTRIPPIAQFSLRRRCEFTIVHIPWHSKSAPMDARAVPSSTADPTVPDILSSAKHWCTSRNPEADKWHDSRSGHSSTTTLPVTRAFGRDLIPWISVSLRLPLTSI